jgi:hypothetical protein
MADTSGSGSARRSVSAGAVAALAWAALEPLDTRLFRSDYSDVAVLGKAVARGRAWLPAGLVLHAGNGAFFGLCFHVLHQRVDVPPRRFALRLALAEHVALYPLCYVVDRWHPRRGEPGIPPLLTNPRAFAQATLRHTVFGALLGRLTG